MSAEGLPTLLELKKSIGPDVSAWKGRRWWVIGGIGLLVLLAGTLVYTRRTKRNLVQYVSAPVTKGDLAVTVESTGTLEAVTSVEVGAEVSGRILREMVEVNDQVHKGQILAEIDPESLNSGLDQSQAQLRGAKDAVNLAQATASESARMLIRNQQLGKEGILSQSDQDAALTAKNRDNASLHSAQENARVAKATVDLTASKLRKATIRAPIDGVVLARLMEPGQTVTAGFQTPVLFKLAQDLSKMRLKVDIDEADVSRIHGGETATFTVEAYPGRNFPSQVVSLQMEPKISQNVVTYQAVLSVDNRDRALLPGMTCTATIQAETKRGVLLVPNTALRFTPPVGPGGLAKNGVNFTDGKHRVWVLKGKVLTPLEVKTGATDGRLTEVLGSDLQEGLNVLTDTKGSP
ncbi:MAG: efflux RND transporter periplasmic adaptor subunit [Holophaga sp.]